MINGHFNVIRLKKPEKVVLYRHKLTQNGRTQMLDTLLRRIIVSKTLIDHVIRSESLSNMNRQFDFGDITDDCALHVSYIFPSEKPTKKSRKPFPFHYHLDEKTKILESLEQWFPSVFPSDCANDDVNHFVRLLQQTNDNKTRYSELKKKPKNWPWFVNSVKNLLKKTNSVYQGKIASLKEPKMNRYRKWETFIVHFDLRKNCSFPASGQFVWQKIYQKCVGRNYQLLVQIWKNLSGVLIKIEIDWAEPYIKMFSCLW